MHKFTLASKDWAGVLVAEKCCSMSFIANINNACTTKYYIGDGNVQHELKKTRFCQRFGGQI